MAEQATTEYPEQPGGTTPPVAPTAVMVAGFRTVGTSEFAIAGFVLSLLWFGGAGSVLGVAFGVAALGAIKRGGGWTNGRGLALAAIVVGALGLLADLVVLLVLASS